MMGLDTGGNDDQLKLEMDLLDATGDGNGKGSNSIEVQVFIGFDEDDDNDNEINLRNLFNVTESAKTGYSVKVSIYL